MPLVGKGTPMEKNFPYSEDGIAQAKAYAAENGLEIERDEGEEQGPGPQLGASNISEEQKLGAVRKMLGGAMGQGPGRY